MVDPTGHYSVYYSQIRDAAQTSYNYSIEYGVKANDALMAYNSVMATSASYFGGQNQKDKRASSLRSQYIYNKENADYYEKQGDYFRSQLAAADQRARKESVDKATKQEKGVIMQVSQNFSFTLFWYTYEHRWTMGIDSYGNAAFQETSGEYFNMIPAVPASVSSSTILSGWNARIPEDLNDKGSTIGLGFTSFIPNFPFSGTGGIAYNNTKDKNNKAIYRGGEVIIGGLSFPNIDSLSLPWGDNNTATNTTFKIWG